jgi:hypothetical protein
LQAILKNAIETVLDVEAFNHEIETEKADANYLIAARRSLQQVLSTIQVTPPNEPNQD